MLYETLHIISSDLDNAFREHTEQSSIVKLDHVGQHIDDANADKVVISLLHMVEDFTLKNVPNVVTVGAKSQKLNSKVPLNLFILCCSNFNDYDNALKNMSFIIAFFQSKRIFTDKNTYFNRDSEELKNLKDFKITVDLYTPSFDELNQIWGTIGGKQTLSVIYKISVVLIELKNPLLQAPIITQITLKTT
ncbi:DUF4255 domain-containing protein [Belliella kenyensis]|uniref:DUF4255 domain-containing protein n=1 Tax=Belliella kenyensis TaxID=1472724 RepID=A0ABV8EK36_9BACT|nr:DUF4255 domain-containing protein [Belliella kenyensis]MCH7400376.1 DUF4255 domain-containing protein [Belliella kenyensis]MDN3604606.1 DUF4255 domain-containing protein [Belliella kenyensis]